MYGFTSLDLQWTKRPELSGIVRISGALPVPSSSNTGADTFGIYVQDSIHCLVSSHMDT